MFVWLPLKEEVQVPFASQTIKGQNVTFDFGTTAGVHPRKCTLSSQIASAFQSPPPSSHRNLPVASKARLGNGVGLVRSVKPNDLSVSGPAHVFPSITLKPLLLCRIAHAALV